jgi:hypothetical protein
MADETPTPGATPPDGGENIGVQPGQQPPAQTPSQTPPPAETEIVHQIKQSDLDARIKRAEAHAVNELLKALGIENIDGLKAVVDTDKKRRDGEMSELQKTQNTISDLTTKLTAATQQIEEFKSKEIAGTRNEAIRAAANGALDPNDVVGWANGDGKQHLEGLLDDKGNVVKEKVEALVAECAKTKAHWFRPGGPGSPSNAGGKPLPLDAKAKEQALANLANTVHF